MRASRKPQAASLKPPTREELARSRVLVLGMGRAGSAAADFLMRLGAQVTGYDAESGVRTGAGVRRLASRGMKVVSSIAGIKADWAVVSPGLPDDCEPVAGLKRRGIPVVDELDLASVFVPGDIVAVTGTNGKSTTTALIAEMLAAAGKKVFVGGNLAPGRPLSAALALGRKDYYVVEVSSFQLERSRWLVPELAVILNITADHLNRHGTMARYREAKFRILDQQNEADQAVLNRDDPVVMKAERRGRAERRYFSLAGRVNGAYLEQGWFCYCGARVAPVKSLRLRGRHNAANALAAICAAKALGVGSAAIRNALVRFCGLPHRLEPVRTLGGVEYLNNSMCTNPAAGKSSLEAVAADIRLSAGNGVVLITGGREKGLDFGEYLRSVARLAKWVVLFGENAAKLAGELARVGFSGYEIADELGQAVRAARARARRGDVVLFSPAFASFDRFRDFQHRGNAFKREVARLV